MNLRRIIALSAVAFAVAACAPQDGASEVNGPWIGTITTEGNVTTVVNEAGSGWGGIATLVEEASIGVVAGDSEYMLGEVTGVVATAGNIVVADPQVPVVRVYDMAGQHVRNLGREGQGPGEYGDPRELGVRPDGRIVVKDGNRLLVLSIEGDPISTWTVGRMLAFTMLEMPLVVTDDGTPHAPLVVELSSADSDTWKWGMVPVFGGEAGEAVRVPHLDGVSALRLRVGDNSMPVPFSGELAWAFTPAGSMVVGNSAEYRYEVHQASAEVLMVEKTAWEPIPVDSAEASWYREKVTRTARRYVEGWVWNGPDVPDMKPAYQRLMPDRSGRIWVQRAGRGKHLPDCRDETESEADCWRNEVLLEVFDSDGRFLGSVTPPAGLRFHPRPFIRDDMFVGVVEDEAGTIRVKRYRLVTPVAQ